MDRSECYDAKKTRETKNYLAVEGTVKSFRPIPPGGHSTQSFNVNGVPFEEASGWGSIYFNSEWNNSLVCEGAEVRIPSKDGKIIRVEIWMDHWHY